MKRKLLGICIVLVLTACASNAPTPTDSGVEGQVLIGPICPVVQIGQDCPTSRIQANFKRSNNPDGGKDRSIQNK